MRVALRLIQKRSTLLLILVLSAYEAVASWRTMSAPAPTKIDVIFLFGLIFATFVCVSIVIRSSFIGDRIVIGPIALAFLLWIGINLFRPDHHKVHVIREIVWLMWLISLIAGIIMLMRDPKHFVGPARNSNHDS